MQLPIEFTYNERAFPSGGSLIDLAKIDVVEGNVEFTMPSIGPAQLSREGWNQVVEAVNAKFAEEESDAVKSTD